MGAPLGRRPTTEAGKALALRKPHQQLAKANLAAARSALLRADLARSKTKVEVPFNNYVKMESIEPGLLAGPQSQLAQLIGTDAFWVEAPVPLDRLDWIEIPGVNGFQGERGSAVTVTQTTGAAPIVRKGTILRLLPELDTLGTQARVLIEIEDPLLLKEGGAPGLPLLVGAFVKLEIQGKELDHVVKVPRVALRDGDHVWVMTPDDTLEVRPVTIVWREPDSVFVSEGLTDGERVITSRLATPEPGMKLRLPGQETASSDAAKAPGAAAEAAPEAKEATP